MLRLAGAEGTGHLAAAKCCPMAARRARRRRWHQSGSPDRPRPLPRSSYIVDRICIRLWLLEAHEQQRWRRSRSPWSPASWAPVRGLHAECSGRLRSAPVQNRRPDCCRSTPALPRRQDHADQPHPHVIELRPAPIASPPLPLPPPPLPPPAPRRPLLPAACCTCTPAAAVGLSDAMLPMSI